MAVKIRLTRIGKKRQPYYRVVVTDSRNARDGRFIEQLGQYDPRQEPSFVAIDTERAAYWLGNGAQPTPQAKKLLEIAGAVKARPAAVKVPKAAKVHVVGEEAQKAAVAEDETVVARAQEAAIAAAAEVSEAAAEVSEAAAEATEVAADEVETAPNGEAV